MLLLHIVKCFGYMCMCATVTSLWIEVLRSGMRGLGVVLHCVAVSVCHRRNPYSQCSLINPNIAVRWSETLFMVK
jgi:hypothetical protein